MLSVGRSLGDSGGTIIGVGAERGMALTFIMLGLLVLGIVFVSWMKPSVRNLEDQLPNVELKMAIAGE